MNLGEVFTAIIGFGKLQEIEWLRTDNINKNNWIATRWQTAAIMTTISGEVVEPKKLIKFDWENSEEDETDNLEIEVMSVETLGECANAWGIDLSKYKIDGSR